MSNWLGDIPLGATLDFKFCTVQSTGAPITLAGTPVISAYVDNSTTQITAGITLTADFDSVTGLNNVRVVATVANGYAQGSNYDLVITTGTVNSVSAVGYCVGSFSISARAPMVHTSNVGAVPTLGIVDSGTAQSATATTLVLRSAAAFADNELNGATILITGGSAGVGQARAITGYVGSTDTATVDTWTTTPSGTITYLVIGTPPSSTSVYPRVDVRQYGGTNGTFNAGRPEVNATSFGGTAVTGRDIGASVLLSSGTGTGQLSITSGVVQADAAKVGGQTASAAGTVTFPGTIASTTNITAGTITTVTNLTNAPTSGDLTATMKTSVTTAATAATPTAAAVTGAVGSVTGAVGSVASGGITAASFGAGAIDAAAIAANAIGASELAADAVTEIAAGVLTVALTESYAADGAAPTLAQAVFAIQQFLQEKAISGTTLTVKKLDGVTTALTFTLSDATTPTSVTRAS